jgi:hypothetical protein
VVGDLAQFMTANNLSHDDVVAKAGELDFPESVVDFFRGGNCWVDVISLSLSLSLSLSHANTKQQDWERIREARGPSRCARRCCAAKRR